MSSRVPQDSVPLTLEQVLAQELPSSQLCGFGKWLDGLAPANKKTIEGWIETVRSSRVSRSGKGATNAINGVWISTQLSKAAIEFSPDQINRHIKTGGCCCPNSN